uniref:GRF-type domain-containing protein n=1 Tax=Triticum urartu TaxID=4572 RepID=A0A8R7TT94_TRIUA
MANLNQGADPAALPILPCLDYGRNVVAYVARCGQSAGERFYKCRNHNPSGGGCNFYKWQQAYADHLASPCPAAPPLAQIEPG